MLVVDTSIWVDYFNDIENPQTDFLNTILDKPPIRIGDLILVEVLLGFRQYPDSEKACRILGKFMQESMVNPMLAVQSTRNNRFLRQRGDCL